MTYETVFTKKAIKFLRIKLKKDKKAGERLLKSIKELQKDPYMNKKMEGLLKGTRRQKIGDYRIVYEVLENNEIKILNIGKREIVYKKK